MKISIKNIFRRGREEQPDKMTKDTMAAHREKILAGGRRFKYPLQYAKHKIVINTTIITVVAIIALGVLGWWQLYVVKNSSDFFYRTTQLVALPVADVDGEKALFSDFLLNFRASKFYLAKYDDLNINSAGGKQQLLYKERDALNIAVADAYARKIAARDNIKVESSEVDAVLKGLRSASNGNLNEQTSEISSQRVLGMSASDLRTSVYNSILRSKASFAVDDAAEQTSEAATKLLTSESNLEKVADALNAQRSNSAMVGSSGMISTAASFSGLNTEQIANLAPNKVAGPLKSITDDGYFFVEVIKKENNQVSFKFLKIPLSEFTKQIRDLDSAGKIKRYITINVDDVK